MGERELAATILPFGIGAGISMPLSTVLLGEHIAPERIGAAQGQMDAAGAAVRMLLPLPAAQLYEQSAMAPKPRTKMPSELPRTP